MVHLEDRKNAKVTKLRGQRTCPEEQPHFRKRLAPKFQDGG